jgi:hypothetical protein
VVGPQKELPNHSQQRNWRIKLLKDKGINVDFDLPEEYHMFKDTVQRFVDYARYALHALVPFS